MVALVFSMMTVCGMIPAASDANQTDAGVTITYLANEGVFLSDGSRGVLIDALFREGVTGYATLAPDVREKVETAKPPYDITRLVLVTHRHRDHFDAASVVRHLQSNPRAKLVTSTQVAERVRAAEADALDAPKAADAVGAPDASAILPRIQAFTPQEGQSYNAEHDGLKVELFFVSHGSGRFAGVVNLGYVVTIGHKRILHIGDAELGPGAFDPVGKFAKNIDVACLPYWWLITRTGRAFVAEALPGVKLVAIHIEPAKASAVIERIHKFLPDAAVFTEPGQTMRP